MRKETTLVFIKAKKAQHIVAAFASFVSGPIYIVTPLVTQASKVSSGFFSKYIQEASAKFYGQINKNIQPLDCNWPSKLCLKALDILGR